MCSVDVGGTFTDSVLIDEEGRVTTAKAPSTDDVVSGFFNSLETAATKIDLELDELFDQTIRVSHGTTVSTNMIVEGAGAKTGLITTQGHEDEIKIMRGNGKVTNEPPENVFRVTQLEKPDPIVPQSLVWGIPERVDAHGQQVVELDEEAAREAVRSLVDEGVEAIAVSFLWAFRNAEHEQRLGEIIQEEAPDVYVSCSHEVSSTLGEYERTVATCINSMVGPGTADYLGDLEEKLDERFQFDDPFLLMQCNGGTVPGHQASDSPIMLIGSGPVGGIRASARLVEEIESENVIATDMGGTSFEVGLIQDGDPLVQNQTVIESYPYNISKLDIESIGAGGGSIAHVDEYSNSLRVGPESAGANPGPACYRRGGEHPTVTDADLLLGYIDPDARIGEHITPSKEHAHEAMERLADKLGLSVNQTARGIYDVVNTKMANLMENKIIGQGYDPRDFSLISYGGAGPIHAASYSGELGVESVLVPGDISPVWSAYGISQSDIRYALEEEVVMLAPFDPEGIQAVFDGMESRSRELLAESGIDEEVAEFDRMAKMRYEDQVHELNVAIPSGRINEDTVETIIDRFENQYEQRYSAAARLPEARPEIVSLSLEPIGRVAKFDRQSFDSESAAPDTDAELSPRSVFLSEKQPEREVTVYDGTRLRPGNTMSGPVIIDLDNTSIVAHEGQKVTVSKYNDFEITL
ncbi:hydantoinase/oxoprolinase family protein [Haladaptatus sp. CMAA 1911]|uniref:hydantoinase/oxoprolinase family protein n=1 Tax=unclassified Haladaptatus TaxID=2622732 RepID=UPI003754D3EB